MVQHRDVVTTDHLLTGSDMWPIQYWQFSWPLVNFKVIT